MVAQGVNNSLTQPTEDGAYPDLPVLCWGCAPAPKQHLIKQGKMLRINPTLLHGRTCMPRPTPAQSASRTSPVDFLPSTPRGFSTPRAVKNSFMRAGARVAYYASPIPLRHTHLSCGLALQNAQGCEEQRNTCRSHDDLIQEGLDYCGYWVAHGIGEDELQDAAQHNAVAGQRECSTKNLSARQG